MSRIAYLDVELIENLLKKTYKDDKNIFVSHKALLALATIEDKKLSFLKKFLKDKNPEIVKSKKIAIQRLENS